MVGLRRLDESRRNGRDLAPAVAELLKEQGWKPATIQAVIVSRGPGSYTGLRVGVMSAKTFAYAVGCVLLAIDTFAALAEQAPEDVNLLDVLADAQKDRIYVQSFRRLPQGWQAETPLSILPFEEWLAGRRPEAWVSGPGLLRWEARLPADVPRLPQQFREPQAESLLRLGLARFRAGQGDDVWGVEPLYLRPSAAEEQWRAPGR